MVEAYSIIADESFINALKTQLEEDGFDHDEPQVFESLADAADAPIGPQEIQMGLQLLTVAIGTATSLTVLVDKILELRRKLQSSVPIRIVDVKTAENKAVIPLSATDDDVRRQVGSA